MKRFLEVKEEEKKVKFVSIDNPSNFCYISNKDLVESILDSNALDGIVKMIMFRTGHVVNPMDILNIARTK